MACPALRKWSLRRLVSGYIWILWVAAVGNSTRKLAAWGQVVQMHVKQNRYTVHEQAAFVATWGNRWTNDTGIRRAQARRLHTPANAADVPRRLGFQVRIHFSWGVGGRKRSRNNSVTKTWGRVQLKDGECTQK